MPQVPPLWLVVNSASGSNDPSARAALMAMLDQAGSRPDRVIDVADGAVPDQAAISAAGIGTLAIFAGDGTLSSLVPQLEGWSGAVLVLPGGTANLLARALHGDRDTSNIVAAFAAGDLVPVRRPCIRFPGHLALIEVLAGPGASWSEVREGLRAGDVAEIATRTIEAVKQSAAGAKVVLVDPPLGDWDGYAGLRLAPTPDGLKIEGYRPDSVADYLKQGIALLRRDFREGPHDNLGRCPRVVCRSEDRSAIDLMIDGERVSVGPEVAFSLSELDVTLLSLGHA